MVAWPAVPLEEMCSRITVGHVGPMADQYVSDGVPFLRSQNVRPFQVVTDQLKFIPAEFHERLRKCALSPGDVVVVRTGYPGTAAVIPQSMPVANCADLVVITPGPHLDPYFLCALFNSTWGIASVAGRLVGSAQQHFNIGAARRLEVHLPPMETQRKIVSVLSAYDELIENNRRRTKLLEEMALRIYREWFVDLRYPGHESKLLVESEVGLLPDGWSVRSLAEVSRQAKTTISPSKWPEEDFEHFSIPAFDDGQLAPVERGAAILSNKFLVEGPCVLYAKLNPRIRRVWWIEPTPGIRAVASTEFLVLAAAGGWNLPMLFATLRSRDFAERVIAMAVGTSTSHQRVKPHDLFSLRLVDPGAALCDRYEDVAGPLITLASKLRFEGDIARRMREVLLPRLVSGEIDVDDLDISVEEAAA